MTSPREKSDRRCYLLSRSTHKILKYTCSGFMKLSKIDNLLVNYTISSISDILGSPDFHGGYVSYRKLKTAVKKRVDHDLGESFVTPENFDIIFDIANRRLEANGSLYLIPNHKNDLKAVSPVFLRSLIENQVIRSKTYPLPKFCLSNLR